MNSDKFRNNQYKGVLHLFGALSIVGGLVVSGSGVAGASIAHRSLGGKKPANIVAKAKAVTSEAEHGLVFSLRSSGSPITSIVPMTSWDGPTTAPRPPRSSSMSIVYCAPGTACQVGADDLASLAEARGWTVHLIAGDGSNASYVTGMDSAIAQRPKVIVGVAIDPGAVAQQLATAKSDGIMTISDGNLGYAVGSGPGYDAYVGLREPLFGALNVDAAISATRGHVHALLIKDGSASVLTATYNAEKAMLASCGGCTATTLTWITSQALDPTEAESLVEGALRANPTTNWIFEPYSISVSALYAAIGQAGLSGKVGIAVKDGDATGLKAISEKEVVFDTGGSQKWLAYATFDQIIRGADKKPFLKAEQEGLGAHLFYVGNLPKSDNADAVFASNLNFVKDYDAIWSGKSINTANPQDKK